MLNQAKIKNCTLTLFSNKAFYIGPEREQIHPDFYRMDFINRSYTSEQIQKLITQIQNAEKINSTFSGNLKREI